MKVVKIAAAAAIGSVFLTGSVLAETISFTGSVERTTTDWDLPISPAIPGFDGSLGSLTGVEVVLSGTVSGDAKGESLDAEAQTVTLDLTAVVAVNLPSEANALVVTAVASESFDASAHDGGIDFGGTSGAEFTDISGTDSITIAYGAGDAAFADFQTGGDVGITCVGEGDSTGSGAGNLITQFNTDAACDVTVTYTFDAVGPPPGIAAPAPLALFAASLFGIWVAARRRA